MKHPALTRLFSIVLAILCLTMLLAGLGCAAGAVSGRGSAMADLARLEDRIEEYRQILSALDGGSSYQELDYALSEEREQHDDQASQHRMDLAVYTATRGGIRAGAEALDQAEDAFAQGKAQYQAGLALFEEQEAAFWEGYRQFQEGKQQLEDGRKTMELAQAALSGLRTQLEQNRTLAAILESEDENARKELSVAAYDSLLQSLDQAVYLYDMLKDQGGISAEQVQQLAAMLAQQTDADLSWLTEEMAWEGITEESLAELETRVAEATGMTVDEIRAQIQQQRDSVAGQDADVPISEEQFEALQAAYIQAREWLQTVDSAMEEKLSEYESQLAELEDQLNTAQEQIEALEPCMEQGKAAIEQARAALDLAGSQMRLGEQGLADGRRQLEEQAAELDAQAEKLRAEKVELDAEAEALEKLQAAAEEQREQERRETSVRLMLLEREGIQTRVDSGMALLPAAEDYAEALLRQTEATARGRLCVSALMILGAIAGFAAIPAAFEKTKKRFWLIAPVLLCFGCAVGAELLCRSLGRGDSYSALSVAAFATVQLFLVIPKEKRAAGSL